MAERFAAAMVAAVAVVVELVSALVLAIDVPLMEPDVHYRPDYPDAVSMTVAQPVNRYAAVEPKVALGFAESMMQQLALDSLGLILAPMNTVEAIGVEILPIPWIRNFNTHIIIIANGI